MSDPTADGVTPVVPSAVSLGRPDISAERVFADLVQAGMTPSISARAEWTAGVADATFGQPPVAKLAIPAVDHDLLPPPAPAFTTDAPRRSWSRRSMTRSARWARNGFRAFWLITLMAVMTALPIIQLVAFGYLLDVAGRLAKGGNLRDALDWLRPAGQLGLAILATLLVSLPIGLLGHWATVGEVISPGSRQAQAMRIGAIMLVVVGTIYLAWALARGGRWWHYLWPQPLRFLREAWRPSTWASAADRGADWLGEWQFGRRFWLGLRGAIATLIWLLPATVIILVNRHGQSGLAGLIGGVAFLALGITLLYLPMLQAHFAAQGRFAAMFEVRKIRADFRRAPWAWLAALILTLVVLPIPLYLLKIEPPPPELVWLPTWLFIAFMLPARIACGLALRRAGHRPEPQGRTAALSRWLVRLLTLPVVAVYLLFVLLSQFTSWDGLQTWVHQHAVLVPAPFVGS